jgi:hypothetical protein
MTANICPMAESLPCGRRQGLGPQLFFCDALSEAPASNSFERIPGQTDGRPFNYATLKASPVHNVGTAWCLVFDTLVTVIREREIDLSNV